MDFNLDFPHAYGKPGQQAILKYQPADFVVEEVFDFNAANEGEHLYLHLQKTGENTQYLADALATFFNIKKMDVGVAGMKDRQAVTSQWFSCYLPGTDTVFDLKSFLESNNLQVELLAQVRHTQKLRRGSHYGNRFEIRLREISRNEETEQRLQLIKKYGVPNYFGEQRFGRDGSNLMQFAQMLNNQKSERELAQAQERKQKKRKGKKGGRNTNSMLISAARSYLFNLVLGERVRQQNWQSQLDGELLLEGKGSGPLWGRGRLQVTGALASLENFALENMQDWCNSLEHSGLSQERRPLILTPQNLDWQWQEDNLLLSFQLNPGEYATSVIREVCLTGSV